MLLISVLFLSSLFGGCQTSRDKSEDSPSETKVELVDCSEDLFLECEDGKIDRCVLYQTGKHECVIKPDNIVFKCSESIGFHCPKGEVDKCSFDPSGDHECVPDPKLAEDFPKACDNKKMLSCEKGTIDACELDASAEHKCVPHEKEYLVKFKSSQGLRLMATSLPKKFPNAKTLGQYLQSKILHIAFNNIDVVNSAIEISKLLGRDDVEYVVENIKVKAIGTPDDPRFAEQWSHQKVGATQAWDKITGNRKIVVAVVDTGVDYNHPDLAANMFTNSLEIPGNGVDDDRNGYIDDVKGWDFFDNDSDPMDETSASQPGHGTHCAGIVGAVGNNSTGIAGASHEVTILPIRFLGPKGEGGLMGAVNAIDYAVDMGADIISASFGVSASSSQVAPILEAIKRAEEKGILFVAAASNEGKNNDNVSVYPANAPYLNVISVAASDRNDAKPTWSNYGQSVHLAAPGADILSTLPDSKYGSLSGTSMATPYVAGAAALLLAQNKALEASGVKETDFSREVTSNPERIRSLLQKSGKKVNIETACQCRIDVASAFTALDGDGLFISPTSGVLAVGEEFSLSVLGGDSPYTFTSSKPTVASVDSTGKVKAVAIGETTLTVKDSNQRSVESFPFRVADQQSQKMTCPLSWPRVCSIVCYFAPDLGWCN